MTETAIRAFKRLCQRFAYEKDAMEDLQIVGKQIEIAEQISKAAVEASAKTEVLEAKIAAMQEANKGLASELRKSEVKFNMLVLAIGGVEKAKKYICAAEYGKAASAMEELAEEARKELGGGKS